MRRKQDWSCANTLHVSKRQNWYKIVNRCKQIVHQNRKHLGSLHRGHSYENTKHFCCACLFGQSKANSSMWNQAATQSGKEALQASVTAARDKQRGEKRINQFVLLMKRICAGFRLNVIYQHWRWCKKRVTRRLEFTVLVLQSLDSVFQCRVFWRRRKRAGSISCRKIIKSGQKRDFVSKGWPKVLKNISTAIHHYNDRVCTR